MRHYNGRIPLPEKPPKIINPKTIYRRLKSINLTKNAEMEYNEEIEYWNKLEEETNDRYI